MYLNEATLLNNVRIRYMKNAIYVSVRGNFECRHILPSCSRFHSSPSDLCCQHLDCRQPIHWVAHAVWCADHSFLQREISGYHATSCVRYWWVNVNDPSWLSIDQAKMRITHHHIMIKINWLFILFQLTRPTGTWKFWKRVSLLSSVENLVLAKLNPQNTSWSTWRRTLGSMLDPLSRESWNVSLFSINHTLWTHDTLHCNSILCFISTAS